MKCEENGPANILIANEFTPLAEPTETEIANAISFEAWAKLSNFLSHEEVRNIWINVGNGVGVGERNGFLCAFAQAYLVADYENRSLLDVAARALIRKYNLFDPIYLKETV